jgi:hypothetical protein
MHTHPCKPEKSIRKQLRAFLQPELWLREAGRNSHNQACFHFKFMISRLKLAFSIAQQGY